MVEAAIESYFPMIGFIGVFSVIAFPVLIVLGVIQSTFDKTIAYRL